MGFCHILSVTTSTVIYEILKALRYIRVGASCGVLGMTLQSLKRTKIGDDTTYKVEFKLPCIPECLNLSISPKALSTDSTAEAAAKPLMSHESIPLSKVCTAASQIRIKRIPWTPEEDTMLRRMRRDDCLWE
jgi:hypothetical protein